MKIADFFEAEACMSRSAGHCMTMGTASTMASMVEALGMGLPHNAAIPAVDSRRYVLAQQAGRRIVEMVHEDLRISRILTRQAFENAIRVNAAIGGSSNFVLHMLAIAGRVGVPLTLDDFDRVGHHLPLLVDIQPSGTFLMEDFYYAGGVPAVVRELADVMHRDALTVNGKTIGENTADAPCWNREVIRERANPIREHAGLAVVRGNLAPNGAVIKPSAATPSLLKHRGRAVVFESIEDFKARIDRPDLEIEETSVMVLKGAGPKGYPGMPEVGNMPLPPKLLARGITDLVRISDARMSGTAYGTVVLHVSPESAAGGTLAVVENGDEIELDIDTRKLELRVSDDELNRRRAAWKPAPDTWKGGYQRLYIDHVLQADQGADLDFLVGCRGAGIPRESH
jgi:dihydroxy-acid dehydratase